MTKRHLDSLSLWEQFSPLFPIKTRWHQPNCCRKRSCNYCRNKSRDLGTRTHIRIDLKKFSRKIIVHCKIIGQRLQFNEVPKLWTMRLQTHARTHTHQIIREQFALCNMLMLSVLFFFQNNGRRRSNLYGIQIKTTKSNKWTLLLLANMKCPTDFDRKGLRQK